MKSSNKAWLTSTPWEPFSGKSVIDFAGPMLNEGSDGVNVLEILEGPPELKDIIAQHHEFYLQQEAELKLKREEWVNQNGGTPSKVGWALKLLSIPPATS